LTKNGFFFARSFTEHPSPADVLSRNGQTEAKKAQSRHFRTGPAQILRTFRRGIWTPTADINADATPAESTRDDLLALRSFRPGLPGVQAQTSTVGSGTIAFMDADGRIPARVTAA